MLGVHDCEFGFFIPHCLDVDRLFSFGGDGISVWDVKDERRLVGIFYLGDLDHICQEVMLLDTLMLKAGGKVIHWTYTWTVLFL